MSDDAGSWWGMLSTIEQAEASVLAGVMSNNDLIDELRLSDDDFENPRFANYWSLITRLRAQGQPIDPITLGHHMPDQATDFWQITTMSFTSPEFHAEIVREAATRRKLSLSTLKIKALAENPEIPLGDVEDAARAAVDEAIGIRLGVAPKSGDVVRSVVENIGKSDPAFRTPWPKLTAEIRGLRPGGFYVIGARPGVGKSAIMLQMLTTMEQYGHVGLFTLEMGKEEVTKRLISQQTGLAYRMVDSGKPLPDWAMERITEWEAAYPGRLLFDDRGGITISEIRAQVRSWKREHPDLNCIAIDYLQLMTSGGRGGADRVQQVGEFSRQCKLIARDFGIVTIALSQLNRNPEQRADKLPAMSDLRESGAIEQDADVIILPHRDMDLTTDASPLMDLIVAKNRQGPTGKITLDWEGEFMRATGGLN